MKIGLVALDGKMPNLAIMRLASYHRARGDEVIFPYDNRGADKVYCSAIFTKTKSQAEWWDAWGAEVGGTGWDVGKTLPSEVEVCLPDYSLYPEITYSIGFTSRGCIRRCPFCFVPTKEGDIRSVATVPDLLRPDCDFLALLDNNFLANPDRDARLDEIERLDLTVNFNQGLDIRLVDANVAGRLARIKTSNLRRTRPTIHFAFDFLALERAVRRGVALLRAAGITPWRLMFYVLCGFDSTFEEDMARFRILRELGVDPYAMVFNDNGDRRLRRFERWVNARIYKVCSWEDYVPWAKEADQLRIA
jgi:hypothetical protein